MKLTYLAITVAMFLLAGCAEEKRNQVQYDFVRKLGKTTDELLSMQTSKLLNKGDGGKLVPEDIDGQIATKSAELNALFQSPPNAELWDAEIVTLKRDGRAILIVAGYGNNTYILRILDPIAKKTAENFRNGEDIKFTGRLMAESSATSIGAFVSPEFAVYPTKVVRGDLMLTQSDQLANDGRIAEEKAVDDKQRQKAANEYDDNLKQRIKEICQETVLRNLRYPASAYFPTIWKKYDKGPDGNWIYYDVVSATNDEGADIPRRFQCAGQVEGDEVVVRLNYLD